MRACILLSVGLFPFVGGTEHALTTGTYTDRVGSRSTKQAAQSRPSEQAERLHHRAERSFPAEDHEDIMAGPDPFFADLLETASSRQAKETASDRLSPRMYYVEVYENEARGLGRPWRELVQRSGRSIASLRWTYQDGSAALPPSEIRPPDDWDWVSEWKIDRSSGRDQGGWEYATKQGKFGTRQGLRRNVGKYRRRRWVRAMSPERLQQRQETDDVGIQLETANETPAVGAPALNLHAYEHEPGLFSFDVGRDVDIDLLPAPDIDTLGDRTGASVGVPALGNAVTAVKGWWAEDFTFRGFGIGIVKPVFRGMLLRPDVGVGIRLPLTLHFRSWEKQEALPSIAASLFVLWPPAVQVSQALSYPAELLQEWATAAVRKVVVPSKAALQARQRRDTVQRLGVTFGVRYSTTYGLQWWLAPYFFLLPGVRLLWLAYESFMAVLLSSMALMQRSENGEGDTWSGKDDGEVALWLLAVRTWAAAKTSGLGYSLYYSGNRLGGAVLVNFMPFFLPTFSVSRSQLDTSVEREGELVGREFSDSASADMTDESSKKANAAPARASTGAREPPDVVTPEMDHDHGTKMQPVAA